MEKIKELLEGPGMNISVKREGIVLKSLDENKIIFLLNKFQNHIF